MAILEALVAPRSSVLRGIVALPQRASLTSAGHLMTTTTEQPCRAANPTTATYLSPPAPTSRRLPPPRSCRSLPTSPLFSWRWAAERGSLRELRPDNQTPSPPTTAPSRVLAASSSPPVRMSWAASVSRGLREVRIHMCQTGQSSKGAR